jgi:hypothetical protein
MQGGIDEASTAPADGLRQECAQRPTHRAGETAEQRQVGDGSSRLLAVELPERCEHGVVEAGSHADAEHEPSQQVDRQARSESDPGKADGVEQRARSEHRSATPAIDDRPDSRCNQAGNEKADRYATNHPAQRPAGIRDDRLSEHGGKIE